jgi:short-subunit dehydrogenase involved in D-alanine esterification of teichoic acids
MMRLLFESVISLFIESSEYIFMKNKTILIAGGSGFIGQALAERWGRENRIVILGRQAVTVGNNTYGRQKL